MNDLAVHIEPFDLRSAPESALAVVNDFKNWMRAEREPGDPPIPLDEAVIGWRNLPPLYAHINWAAWSRGRAAIVGWAGVEYLRANENTHVVEFHIEVLAAMRRRGLGRQLLAHVVTVPRKEGRRLMISWTSDRIRAGDVFMQRLAARKTSERHTNQLLLADVPPALLQTWLARARERASAFDLGLWAGPYPEADLPAIVALNHAMNDEPRDGMDMEDHRKTPEEIRQWERALLERGSQRWSMYARERATGVCAGYTEVFWNPNRPQLMNQGATGVLPRYRGLGLARWLKAAMYEKVVRERPEVVRIRTGNADSNAPMLKINFELGFKPYISQTVWQVETQQVEGFVGGKSPSSTVI
jgi:mycothiol synthase